MTTSVSLQVMSFNIRGAIFSDGVNHWNNRSGLNVTTLRRYMPDLIGFQELHLANLTVYLRELPEYSFFIGPPYNNQQPFQFPAIFWNKEKLHRVSSGGFWLSQTPDIYSSSWDTACIRSTAWVILIWQPTGLEFVLFNTHLDHISEFARQESANLILNRIDPSVPVILTGDFNCLPGSPVYHTFLSDGFLDTYEQAGYTDSAITFHNFEGQGFTPRYPDFDRIDWILWRGWNRMAKIKGFSIIKDADPPLYPSDHYPILASLRAII